MREQCQSSAQEQINRACMSSVAATEGACVWPTATASWLTSWLAAEYRNQEMSALLLHMQLEGQADRQTVCLNRGAVII